MPVILNQGGDGDSRCLPLTTRKNRKQIVNELKDEWLPSQVKGVVSSFRSRFPNVRIRSLSKVYNCMGHVFGSRRTWINTDQLNMILSEDGYKKLGVGESPVEGDLVIYVKNDVCWHIGLVQEVPRLITGSEKPIKILSKWGELCEVIHEVKDFADGAYEHQFWSERKNV